MQPAVATYFKISLMSISRLALGDRRDHFSESCGDSQRVGMQELPGGLKAQIHSGRQAVGWLAKGTCVHCGLSLARDFKGLQMLRPFVRSQGALANFLTPQVQNRPRG